MKECISLRLVSIIHTTPSLYESEMFPMVFTVIQPRDDERCSVWMWKDKSECVIDLFNGKTKVSKLRVY